MARSFFGSGFFPSPSADPDAYTALVAAFGSEAAADFYIADLVGYATGVEAQSLLDAAQAYGTPGDATALLISGGTPTIPRDRALAVTTAYPTGLVSMLYPTTTGVSKIEDLAGTLADGDWAIGSASTITGFTQLGLRGRYERVLSGAANAPFRLTGALTMHLVFYAAGSTAPGYAAVLTSLGGGDANNYLWGFTITAAIIQTYHEKAGGVAVTGSWTRPSAPVNAWSILTITRSATGRHRVYINGVLLTGTAAVNGTVGPGGEYIDLDLPVGGSNAVVYLGKDPSSLALAADIGLFGFYSVEQSAVEVAAIVDLLGYS